MPSPLMGLVNTLFPGLAHTVTDYALGKPFSVWGHAVDARNAPRMRTDSYRGNWTFPNILPSPDALLQAWRCGLLTDRDAAYALGAQGIGMFYPRTPNITSEITDFGGIHLASAMDSTAYDYYSRLWYGVSLSSMSRPGPGDIAQLMTMQRIDEHQAHRLLRNVYADTDMFRMVSNARYQMPGVTDLWQLWRLGHITGDEYYLWCMRLGWTNREALSLAQSVTVMPGLTDLIQMRYRGLIDTAQFTRYTSAAGWTDREMLEAMVGAQRPIPGFGDLVSLAVREVWDEGVVQRWGYDAEFPYPLAAWARKQGWDWGEEVVAPDGTRYPRVSWPQAHWRAHWRPMPLDHAYRAFQRFRPERMQRYRGLFPDIKPFTGQLLNDVIKVADYPPAVRDWLAALARPVLPIMSIRQLYRYGIRSREWARQELLDRGYLPDHTEDMLDLLGADEEIALRRQRLTIIRRLVTETIAETRAAYRMGGLDMQAARSRLSSLGFGPDTQSRMLALEDARAAREGLVQFISQLRRSYLTGALADSEVVQSMTAAQIAPPAIQRYLRLWTAELTVERRSLSTQQLTAAVAAGELTPAVAAVRLSRLGWTQPDAALLLQRAVAQLTRAQARAAQQAVNTAARQAKALQAANRQAQAAALSAQAKLRRIYPIATLKRQFCLGIRKGSTISGLLTSQGYTPDSISALLSQWAMECEASPPNPDKRVGSLESYARRQTPLGTLKQWWQNGIVTDKWTRARLAAIGLEPSAIELQIKLWQSTLGKKSGPAAQATAQTQPTL